MREQEFNEMDNIRANEKRLAELERVLKANLSYLNQHRKIMDLYPLEIKEVTE